MTIHSLVVETQEGTRGPAGHAIRDQIVAAAHQHFTHYGYAKTTVSDLAKAIGFSKGYIYKFFESKQAIGEAICSDTLAQIIGDVELATANVPTAAEGLRVLLRTITDSSMRLFFNERELYDIAAHSSSEGWSSVTAYKERVGALIQDLILRGRASGEFERKVPADEASRAIMLAYQSFMDPLHLQFNLDKLPDGPIQVTALVLRSLAP